MRRIISVCVMWLIISMATRVEADPRSHRFSDNRTERGFDAPRQRSGLREPYAPGSKRGGRFTPDFIRDLGLTAEQRGELMRLREAQRSHWQEQSALEKDRQELRRLMQQHKTPRRDVLEQFERVQKSETELRRRRLDNILRLREVLTPQQFRKVQDRLEEFREQSPRH